MEKIYVSDTLKITAELSYEGDFSDADVIKFQYIKPDGTTGDFDAEIVNQLFMQYTIPAGTLTAGTWSFNAYIEQDSEKYHGDTFYLEINEAGK